MMVIRIVQTFLKNTTKGPPVVFNIIICRLLIYPFKPHQLLDMLQLMQPVTGFAETPDSNVTYVQSSIRSSLMVYMMRKDKGDTTKRNGQS